MQPEWADRRGATDASGRRFREQETDGDDAGADVEPPLQERLEPPADEDRGGDPYNHTGRFERNVR